MTNLGRIGQRSVEDAERDILARLAEFREPFTVDEPTRNDPKRTDSRRRRWATAAIIALAMLGSSFATWQATRWADRGPAAAPSAAKGDPAAPAPEAGAEGGAIALEASGYVEARNKSSVSSDITGRIRAIPVEMGQSVQAGQVIAMLDDREARLRLNAARLQMRNDQLEADDARVHLQVEQERFARISSLADRGFASRASFEQAQAAFENARIRVAQAEVARMNGANSLQAAEIFVERHVIRAPFDGVVVEVTARPGETVSPASGGNSFIRTGIVQLVDPASLYIVAEVPERQVRLITPGQPVDIASAGGAASSEVAWISPVSDRQRGIVEVGIALPARGRQFIDGMEVDVRFLRPHATQAQATDER